jgi:hypothetical protein
MLDTGPIFCNQRYPFQPLFVCAHFDIVNTFFLSCGESFGTYLR